MEQFRVVSLNDFRHIEEATIGPKAMSLARMIRAGIPVPAAFCITVTAFQEHLEHNKIANRLKPLLDELAGAGPETRGTLLSNFRQVVVESPMPEPVRRQIEIHYDKLGAERVAVRSSGTAEDLAAYSFAGQHDSFLAIANLDDCIEAVKKCWASLWTLRAYEYRERNGFYHLNTGMAVIVQTLIAAEASCVVFTADPISGSRSSIVIEACFGLGTALVSGKVTPDRFVVSKKNLRLRSRTISDKRVEHVLGQNGSVSEQSVPDERSCVGCLDKRHIRQLARSARRIEVELGSPQDIECAIGGGKVFFVQSRPITALPPEKSWEDRQIWCCNPAKEVIPDVVTPMTLSVIDSILDSFVDPIFVALCMDRGSHPIHGLVAGRIYFNANIWGSVFACLPGAKGIDFMKMTGSHKGLQRVAEGLRNASDEDLPDMKFRRLKFLLKIPLIVLGILGNTPEKGRLILADIEAKTKEWSRLDTSSLSIEQITTSCQSIVADLNELVSGVLYLFSILGALPVLDMACTKWLPEGAASTGELLAGVGGMVDATAGLDIWRLAVSANSRTEVKDIILSDDKWDAIEGRLSQTDSGREFLVDWEKFMADHGHHCRGELELYNKRWIEKPDYILKFVRSHITQMDMIDPVRNFAGTAEKRRRLEQRCREQLRNPIKRFIFNRLLVRSQKGSVFRENVKSEVIKLLATMRRLLLELGGKLEDERVLKNRDDIFFLRFEEIGPAVQGSADFDIREIIASRQAEYNLNKTITPPDVVFGRFDPEEFAAEAVDEHAEALDGVGVSPGAVTGKARVILRADTDEQLLAGEILVAPFTDPGWTPYFVPAVAIVMDEGGAISHGSIIAREYGIPAVVNVGDATKIIKTGQTVQVDGNRGVVTILEEP